jgi:glutathione S-transferase
MVKLYYTPTSCGASSFICAFIAELKFDCEVVDLSTHNTESGTDFYTINKKGNVPALVLDDGTILNENISCLEYIADKARENGVILAPELGSNDRYVVNQLLSFLATELHPSIGLFFNPSAKDVNIREFILSVFNKKMKYLQDHIIKSDKSGKTYIYGDSFTIIDAYLHIILSWFGYVGIDINNYPIAKNYFETICSDERVKNAKKRISSIPKTTF